MENQIYSPMEQILIEGIKTKMAQVEAAKLDQMLLEMEAKFNMMDGLTMEEWLL